MWKVTFLIFLLLFFAFVFVKAQTISISLVLNSTEVEWRSGVNAFGYVRSNGNPWVGNVSVKLNGEEVCFVATDANGFYNCSFSAPSEIGDFSVIAHALTDSTTVGKSNEITLSVIYFYGSKKPTRNVAAIDFPLLIQDLNGKIHKIKAYLKIWK